MFPSLTDLTYFLRVAKELNFSRAAAKLGVSQPSLSIAIKRIETMLGTSLFYRNKQISLTRSGESLYMEAPKLIEHWEQIVTNIKNGNEEIKGRITIGCHSTLAPFLSNIVAMLMNTYPALEIHFFHELSAKIMDNLLKANLDIGLVTNPYEHPNVILQHISDTEFSFWASKKLTNVDLFNKDNVIICDPELAPTQYLLKELKNLTKLKTFRMTTMNNIEAMAMLVAEGYSLGILPSGFTGHYFGDKLMKIPDAPVYRRPLFLAYLPENKNMHTLQIVLNAIREVANSNKG